MKRLVITSMAALLVLGCLFTAPPAWAQSELEGVWQVVEASGTDDEGDWKAQNIQPSLFIFLDGYYSIAVVHGDEARPLMADDATRDSISPDEVFSIFRPYTSNSGTYEISGSTLTTKPMVALWPNFMEGGSQIYAFAVDGDTLSLSWKNSQGYAFENRLRRLR